mmetsp:Transcript_12739/g.34602  ORF Transcript_12739/g.34602 Transcript_12739/m.34602 type:complete len:381 (-) Transcript_12739:4262-5404(-)
MVVERTGGWQSAVVCGEDGLAIAAGTLVGLGERDVVLLARAILGDLVEVTVDAEEVTSVDDRGLLVLASDRCVVVEHRDASLASLDEDAHLRRARAHVEELEAATVERLTVARVDRKHLNLGAELNVAVVLAQHGLVVALLGDPVVRAGRRVEGRVLGPLDAVVVGGVARVGAVVGRVETKRVDLRLLELEVDAVRDVEVRRVHRDLSRDPERHHGRGGLLRRGRGGDGVALAIVRGDAHVVRVLEVELDDLELVGHLVAVAVRARRVHDGGELSRDGVRARRRVGRAGHSVVRVPLDEELGDLLATVGGRVLPVDTEVGVAHHRELHVLRSRRRAEVRRDVERVGRVARQHLADHERARGNGGRARRSGHELNRARVEA